MATLPLSEESLSALRDDIARRMEATKSFEVSIAEEFSRLLSRAGDVSAHGQALWYLMQKEQDGTVNAKKCGVYLQYYYLTTEAHLRARPFRRHLTTIDLCFLIGIASSGFERGRAMFDECFERRVDWSAIQALSVTREAFLAFFYQPPTEQKFSFLRCLEIIDKLWAAWDKLEPKIIHGFITPNFSKKCLEARRHKLGSFMFRFDSKGGLSIDYLKEDGALDSGKVLPDALASPKALCAVLVKAPSLSALVDSRSDASGDQVIPKESILAICEGSPAASPPPAVAPAAAAPAPAFAVQPQQPMQPQVQQIPQQQQAFQPAPSPLLAAFANQAAQPAAQQPVQQPPQAAVKAVSPKKSGGRPEKVPKKAEPVGRPKRGKRSREEPEEDEEPNEGDDEDDEDDEDHEGADEEDDEDGSDGEDEDDGEEDGEDDD